MRERDGQERRAVGAVPKSRTGPPLARHLSPRARGARGPMVAVGDIEHRHIANRLYQFIAVPALHPPQRMAHGIGRRKIKQRLAAGDTRRHQIDCRAGTVRQEHRARLRAQRQHVPRAIVFLVASGPFVLLDDVAVVLVEGEARGQAGLLVAAHTQPIQVEAGLILEHQRRLFQRVEISGRPLVHDICIRIRTRRQLDFGARDAEKAEGVPVCQGTRLVGADHVVGNRSNAGGGGWFWSEGSERMNGRHGPGIISPTYGDPESPGERTSADAVMSVSARSRTSANVDISPSGTGSAGGIARAAVSGLMNIPFFFTR